MIYKNIISFTILYFTDVFKRHFENVRNILPNKMIFSPANDYFCTTKQKMWHTRRNRILFVSVRIHYFLYRNKSLMYA